MRKRRQCILVFEKMITHLRKNAKWVTNKVNVGYFFYTMVTELEALLPIDIIVLKVIIFSCQTLVIWWNERKGNKLSVLVSTLENRSAGSNKGL